MATYSIGLLSGSTHGAGIKVTGTTAGASVSVHDAVANATDIDLVTLWAANSDTVDRVLTLGWGGETDPDNLIEVTIPAGSGLVAVADRLPIRNSLPITAWAAAANVIVIYGEVLKADN